MRQNIRTFRAPSMPEALAIVKREIGPDAVILGTRTIAPQGIGRLMRRQHVEITAGPPNASTSPPRIAARRSSGRTELPESVREDYTRLVSGAVSEEIARRLAVDIAKQRGATESGGDPTQMRSRLERFVASMIPACGGITLRENETNRIALVGPAGAGKTTTLAKLAAHFRLKLNKTVALLSVDTTRLAAAPQLECYAGIIGVPFRCAATRSSVRDALEAFGAVDVLLLDTPGIGSQDSERLKDLRELLTEADPYEAHLVLPSSMAPAAQSKIAGVFRPFGATRVVLTKLDDAVGFGVILNALDHLGLELSYVTVGQRVPQDIIPACGQRIAELILQ